VIWFIFLSSRSANCNELRKTCDRGHILSATSNNHSALQMFVHRRTFVQVSRLQRHITKRLFNKTNVQLYFYV